MAKQGLRKQLVSLEGIQWLDTAKSYYFIPVTQLSLEEPEVAAERQYLHSVESYAGNIGGNFNNILVYHYPSGSLKPIFDRRINIFQYQTIAYDSTAVLILMGWTKDTNQDGKLSYDDNTQLFYYSLANDELYEVDMLGFRYISHEFLSPEKELIITVREDTNNDGEFSDEQDRTILLKHSFVDHTTISIVDKLLLDQLQKIIDG
ncbi:hypothetical protein [Tunicatimonas pelagia]|uniref:hypothetical protein n=1 Tax=Tunicatimonas pelagia TaxID=931531 RepID=UPI002666FA07|nr:hypothetical protein [Tunicatimonas pelagia]WKN46075.1 hypothetical protein P0M28_14055 [Tunicatimonas pelagia]